jgi:fumarate reductase flavoprotein subunit
MGASAAECDVDVLVIGSGAAGLSAALEARLAGASRVLVAESEGRVGGSSRLSGGLIMGAGTRYQRAAGITDDAESLYHDYMTVNRWNVDAAVVKRFCELAGPTVEWLGDLGVEYHERLVFGGDERVPRVHVPRERGQGMVDVLHRNCREADVDIALGRRIDRLLVDAATGAVTGAAVGSDEITAGAVVIASGGFGNDPAKLAEHFPSAARTGNAWYIGAEGARGDALEFTRSVRAQTIGHDRGLRLLHAGFARIYEAYLPGWLVLVNAEGHRFADETAPYGMMDWLIRQQGDRCWAIFDRATIEAASSTGAARYKQTIPSSKKHQSPHWIVDVIDQMVAEGKVVEADTIEAVSRRCGLDPVRVAGTVARYNRSVERVDDDEFAKDPKMLEPVVSPPFYGVEIRPSTVCFTAYGLRITREAEVLDEASSPVPGLFAAGECTGGVVGSHYVGSGNSYANITVFGRIAGRSAAHAACGSPPMTAGTGA